MWNDNKPVKTFQQEEDITNKPTLNMEESDILPRDQDIPILKISEYKKAEDTRWAVMVDIKNPVDDFHEKIPELAHQYPFELDTFQKQVSSYFDPNIQSYSLSF